MSDNIWTIKPIAKGDKNFVIFSLGSLGRADINSLPAGGSRANNRQNQVKNGIFDLKLNGSKTTMTRAKAPLANQKKKQAPRPLIVAVSAKNPPRKAALPAVAKRNGGSKKVGTNQVKLSRPKNFPRPAWNKMSYEEKLKKVKSLKPIPRIPTAAVTTEAHPYAPSLPDRLDNAPSDFGANDFGWGTGDKRFNSHDKRFTGFVPS